jgi:hypothetical protein
MLKAEFIKNDLHHKGKRDAKGFVDVSQDITGFDLVDTLILPDAIRQNYQISKQIAKSLKICKIYASIHYSLFATCLCEPRVLVVNFTTQVQNISRLIKTFCPNHRPDELLCLRWIHFRFGRIPGE